MNHENTEKLNHFENMVTHVYKELYRFIFSIVRNSHLAEDALQNTLLSAYKIFDDLKDANKFKSWVFTIAKREAVLLIKKNVTKPTVEFSLYDRIVAREDNFDFTPEHSIICKELTDTVVEAINLLSDEQKQVVNMRYFNELSFREISKVLGINVNTIRTWHSRAKIRIGRYLEAHYYKEKVHKGRGK